MCPCFAVRGQGHGCGRVCPPPAGTSGMPALHTGTSVCADPVPGSSCVSVCGFAHSCGFAHACSQWLESVRGPCVATCLSVGWFPPKQPTQGSPQELVALSAQRKKAMSCDTIPCHAPASQPIE